MSDDNTLPPANLNDPDKQEALAGEGVEEMVKRLRATMIVRKGEPMGILLPDGTWVQGNTGDIVQVRNPDGPQAADMLERLTRPAGGEEVDLQHIIRNALYRHMPSHIDANLLRAAAEDIRAALAPPPQAHVE